MKKVLSIALAAVLLLAIAIPVKLFFIGTPADPIYYHINEGEDGQLHFNAATEASGIAFRGWKFRQEGTALYISAREVLVSRFFSSGVYYTPIERNGITEVYFGGELIWTAK